MTMAGAVVVPLGFACFGNALLTMREPRLGGTFSIDSVGGPSLSIGVTLLDLARLGTALSLLGCDFWVDFNTALVADLDFATELHTPVAVPPNPGLLGATFTTQSIWADLGLNVLEATNGAMGTIGP